MYAKIIIWRKPLTLLKAGKMLGKNLHKVLSWKDLELTSRCHPEKEMMSLLWIEAYLGYVPSPHIYTPHLAFIQALVENVEKGVIEPDTFVDELLFHVKRIRNDDMKDGKWVGRKYDASDYEYYDTFLGLYKQPARLRLCKLLRYEPDLEYSLGAEVYLRQIFELEGFYTELPYTAADYKAATITWYTELYHTHGEQAADESGLPKYEYGLDDLDEDTEEPE
jgi:hypothetical protein